MTAIALAVGLGSTVRAGEDDEKAEQAKLAAEAKITKDQAQAVATQKIGNGTVKASELENEDGKLVWSLDLTTPNTTDITEVKVDAMTGNVVGVETEKAKGEKNND